MNKNRVKYFLLAIFILTLALRLTLAFTTDNLTYDSYFHLRQVEHIKETGLPLYQDMLSYGGRTNVFLPFFHYLTAGLSFILPEDVITKVLPNLFLSLLVFIAYAIGRKLTNNSASGLFSAAIVGFIPALYFTNSFTPNTFFLPLIFVAIYAFMNLKEKANLYLYLLCFIILTFTTPATMLIIIGYLIYLILSTIERRRINWAEVELMVFSLFFFIWAQFLFYKDILLKEGLGFIWQNVPQQILLNYFPKLSIVESLVVVGIIPFVAGIFVVYRSLFEIKNTKAFLLISLAISTTLLVWLKLLEHNLSLAFFSIIIAIISAIFYDDFSRYIKKTKFHRAKVKIMGVFATITILTIILPAVAFSLNQDTPSNEEIQAFKFLSNKGNSNMGAASSLKEGHLVTYFANKESLMDGQFNLIDDIDQRFKDTNSIYTTKFQTHAIDVFDIYGINYLILTPKTKTQYRIEELNYLESDCFDLRYDHDTKIYEVKCQLTVIENDG